MTHRDRPCTARWSGDITPPSTVWVGRAAAAVERDVALDWLLVRSSVTWSRGVTSRHDDVIAADDTDDDVSNYDDNIHWWSQLHVDSSRPTLQRAHSCIDRMMHTQWRPQGQAWVIGLAPPWNILVKNQEVNCVIFSHFDRFSSQNI